MTNSDNTDWVNWTLPAPEYFLFTNPTLGTNPGWSETLLLPSQIGPMMKMFFQGADLPAPGAGNFRLEQIEPLDP